MTTPTSSPRWAELSADAPDSFRPPRGSLRVLEYLLLVWRRSLVSSLVAAVGAPLLYLLALGFGLGKLVNAGPGAAALGGVSYVQYLAPALITAAALQAGTSEAAFPAYSRFKWTRVFWGMTASPITPRQIADGQMLFFATRLVVNSVLYYLVLLAFGAGGGSAGALVIPVAVLTGLSFCVWVLALSATVRDEGTAFNVVFRFVVIPMTLFSGSFFPIDALPGIVRPLAWISPLWHGNQLARAAALGTGTPLAVLGHVLFLLVLAVVGLLVARRQFRVRLIE
jgi:lipooligosaccharide transport system permease protein